MKIILMQDVKKLGKAGDVLDVSDGYANNFLLPKKLAAPATKDNMNELENKKRTEKLKRQQEEEEAKKLAESLRGTVVKIPVKSGGAGKIFGSVTNKEIAASIFVQTGIDIDKKKISLPEPLKHIGQKEIDIKIHTNVTATITIDIIEG